MKFLESLVEGFYWLLIFISPTVILGFAGFVAWYNFKGTIGIISFIALALAGIGLGIYFAERIRKTVGCSMFLSRNNWSDNKNDNNSIKS